MKSRNRVIVKRILFIVKNIEDLDEETDVIQKRISQFKIKFRETWHEVKKPEALEELELDDVLTYEIILLPENFRYSENFKERLFNLSYRFRNKAAPDYILKECSAKNDIERKLPIDSYAIYVENVWKAMLSACTLKEMEELNLFTKKTWIVNYTVEQFKTNAYNDVISDLLELKKKVLKEVYSKDFGKAGEAIYQKAMNQFIEKAQHYNGFSAFKEKKQELFNIVNGILYELFSVQVKHIKKKVFEKFAAGITKSKSSTEDLNLFYTNLSKSLEDQKDAIYAEAKSNVDELHIYRHLMVVDQELGSAWHIEAVFEEIAKLLNQSITSFKNQEEKSCFSELVKVTAQKLVAIAKQLMDERKKEEFWFLLRKNYSLVMREQEEMIAFICSDCFHFETSKVENVLQGFRKEAFIAFTSKLRLEVLNLSVVYFKQIEETVNKTIKSNKDKLISNLFECTRIIRSEIDKSIEEAFSVLEELSKLQMDANWEDWLFTEYQVPEGNDSLFITKEECEIQKFQLKNKVDEFYIETIGSLEQSKKRQDLGLTISEVGVWVMWLILAILFRYNVISGFLIWLVVVGIPVWKLTGYGGLHEKIVPVVKRKCIRIKAYITYNIRSKYKKLKEDQQQDKVMRSLRRQLKKNQ
jgi:hypothetical protein